MSKVKLYTPDRLILHAAAADYYRANPDATTHQIAQLYALNVIEAREVVRSVKTQNAVKAATMEEAIAWAIEHNAGFMRIADRFHMSEYNSRRIALVAKEANKAKAQAAKEKLDAAMEYANANQLVTALQVAEKFGVSIHSVERLRRRFREAQPAIEDAKRKPRRALFAVLRDGEQVEARRVRDVSKIRRFVEVMV